MKTHKRKPLVLLPADVKQLGAHPFHAVGNKYIMAVAQAAEATPLLVPAISDHLAFDALDVYKRQVVGIPRFIVCRLVRDILG